MHELKEYLTEFRDITIKLIEKVKKEDFDAVDLFLERRQQIIEALEKLSYDKEDFLDISKELGIIEYDKELNNIIEDKREEIKSHMQKLSIRRNANSQYSNYGKNSVIFSKKI